MTSLPSSFQAKFFGALFVGAFLLLAWHFSAVFAPFVASLVLAYGLKPVVVFWVRRQAPRVLAVSISVLAALLMCLILLVLLVPIVSQLVPLLRAQIPDMISATWSELVPWLHQMGLDVPSRDEAKVMLLAWVNSHFAQSASAVFSSVLVGGSGLMALAGWLIMVPMLTFYWLMDWDDIADRAWGLLPPIYRPSIQAVLADCDDVMGQFLRGQVLVMLLMAAYYSVGLFVAGFQLALPIGVFTGLAMCIPYLGFGVGLTLALLSGVLQFHVGPSAWVYPLGAVAAVYGLGQVLESFVLTPRLVGRRIGLHPLVVIFALLLFGQALGFVGVLIALPMSALLVVLGRHALVKYQRSQAYLGHSPTEKS